MYNSELFDMNYVDAIMIVDHHGKIVYSVRYNPRFDKDAQEGEFNKIINKNFLEVYEGIKADESTILDCMKYKKPIYLKEQTFIDYKGRTINAKNLSIPIIKGGKVYGAIELSKDITKIEERVIHKVKNEYYINSNDSSNKAIYNFSDIITVNKDMLHNIERAQMAANNPSSVLIYGETGTGKELFVQSIHNFSNRRNKPFVAQNCAALPENLFESILFGSVKGAYTGAIDRPGLFEVANGGTLFLDEINSMSLNLQAKLLRVLQDKMVRRVGDNKERKVNVRIITAMNIEPTKAVERKYIREDLFYRLSVVNIKLLPLRERKEDIPIYVDYFIDQFNRDLNKNIRGVSEKVKELFMTYDWTGNVREIQHVIESSLNFIDEGKIMIIHLPVYLNENMRQQNESNAEANTSAVKNTTNVSLDEALENLEKEMINEALSKSRGNISKAAALLKITRQRLHYKLSKYDINIS